MANDRLTDIEISAKSRLDAYKEAVAAMYAPVSSCELTSEACERLRKDWWNFQRECRNNLWFFVKAPVWVNGEISEACMMWADELSGCHEHLEERRRFEDESGWDFYPPPPPHGPLADVTRHACPKCSAEGLVVGHLVNDPPWDCLPRWTKTYYVLCENCMLTKICEQSGRLR